MKSRRGFTLVEMLVATALVLFIMVILTEAFVTGLESFRQLKAAGDLQEKMRSVQVILRRDLAAVHFDPGPGGAVVDKAYLSSQDLSLPSSGASIWQPPAQGFFRIWQGSPLPSGIGATGAAAVSGGGVSGVAITNGGVGYTSPIPVGFFGGGGSGAAGTATITGGAVTGVTMTSAGTGYTSAPIVVIGNGYVNEGSDPDGLLSARAVDHILHFTIDLSHLQTTGRPVATDPNRRESFLTALVPAGSPLETLGPVPDFRASGTYTGQWAEVAYYLRQPAGELTANGTPLFALYRRQSLICTDADATTLNMAPRVMTHAPSNLTAAPEDGVYVELSCKDDPTAPGSLFFNNTKEVTIPERRFGTQPTAGTGGTPIAVTGATPASYPIYSDQLVSGPVQTGDDLLITDVVSFEVKVLPQVGSTIGTDFVNLYDMSILPPVTNTLFSKTTGPMVFDTWSSCQTPPGAGPYTYDYFTGKKWDPTTVTPSAYTVPLKIKILALQIILRVWDARTQQTRQVTIIQDM
jgi:prepilin-type N-terminal cleavage/methylation domain-containing protein